MSPNPDPNPITRCEFSAMQRNLAAAEERMAEMVAERDELFQKVQQLERDTARTAMLNIHNVQRLEDAVHQGDLAVVSVEKERNEARQRAEKLEAAGAEMRLELLHIEEYWNGSPGDAAVDAAEEARESASRALSTTCGQSILEKINKLEVDCAAYQMAILKSNAVLSEIADADSDTRAGWAQQSNYEAMKRYSGQSILDIIKRKDEALRKCLKAEDLRLRPESNAELLGEIQQALEDK
jgi:hypothetical protein